MSDEWEWDDYQCPKCYAYPTKSMRCTEISCDDGWVDMHEFDDPMFFDEGDYEMCQTCHGTGWLRWCGSCGYELALADIRSEAEQEQPQ